MTKAALLELLIAGTLIIGGMGVAQAATDEEKCRAGLTKAQGKYEQCVQAALAKLYGGGSLDPGKFSKCRVKYVGAWMKLHGLTGSTTCSGARFVDNGNGTITDNLTGLVWEKKSDNSDIHDLDTLYQWSTGTPYNGDGDAFTTFLRDGLNAGAGFAGTNDWRLPTLSELFTLVNDPYIQANCTTPGCLDTIFNTSCAPGCSVTTCSCARAGIYWGSTTADNPVFAWGVGFDDGSPGNHQKVFTYYIRAVRGGL